MCEDSVDYELECFLSRFNVQITPQSAQSKELFLGLLFLFSGWWRSFWHKCGTKTVWLLFMPSIISEEEEDFSETEFEERLWSSHNTFSFWELSHSTNESKTVWGWSGAFRAATSAEINEHLLQLSWETFSTTFNCRQSLNIFPSSAASPSKSSCNWKLLCQTELL